MITNSYSKHSFRQVVKLVLTVWMMLLSTAVYAAPVPDTGNIQLNNGKLRLTFNKSNGGFIAMEDMEKHTMISHTEAAGSYTPWELSLLKDGVNHKLDIRNFSDFRYETSSPRTLTLTWKNGRDIQNNDFKVTVTVTLQENKPLSSWHIAVEGLKNEVISSVVFPRVAGLSNTAEEYLAVPSWMGELLKNPGAALAGMKGATKKFEWVSPGHLSMQLLALYNKQGKGFYASCDDVSAYRKNMAVLLDNGALVYQLENFPALDSPQVAYKQPYNAIVGSFHGDWITAAEQYREWAVQQSWCADSRLTNNATPEWLKNTALWVWNRGRSEQVLKPAVDLKERLGLPVNVLWHWWHGCSYDDGFPEYLPPREGKESFIKNVKWSQEHGVKSLVYMNQFQWGTSTQSWKAEQPYPYALKDSKGNLSSHVFNIFSGKALTIMCVGTSFWKNKYAALADSVINDYHVNGVYMDQTCLSYLCFDKSHGHTIGGGNYWVHNSTALSQQIRSKVLPDKKIALAGEGVGENWLPYVDAFLVLQVSRERYAGTQDWEPIPFFQVVYHPYGITYGNYSSLLTPPYDELWPAEHRPANTLQPLDTIFNKQFLMEQARSYTWGMQPMISNYLPNLATERKTEIDYLLTLAKVRNKCLKYLLHGEFRRAPEMVIPEEELSISKLSIYAGQKEKVTTFHKKYPVIYSSSWKSADNMLGIAIASIHDKVYPVKLNFKSADYDLPASGKVYLVNATGKKLLGSYSNGNVRVNFPLQTREICLVEIAPD
ncbi:DUF6259 domain-containing protein [Chitinophaga sp. MM2321]|uniref:DUF6259 domain-containing protein n=1 Tax=Chitinophaga sp. MM2321 TaxID=3137178 RepID=UPI0032D56A7D